MCRTKSIDDAIDIAHLQQKASDLQTEYDQAKENFIKVQNKVTGELSAVNGLINQFSVQTPSVVKTVNDYPYAD